MNKITKPQKAEGALMNTWIVDIDGSENRYIGNVLQSKPKVLTVRFTSDTRETISISDDNSDIQFTLPFKKIDELIKCAREEYAKRKN